MPLPKGVENGDIVLSGTLAWFIWQNTRSRIWWPYASPDGYLSTLMEGADATGRLIGVDVSRQYPWEVVLLTSKDFRSVQRVYIMNRASSMKYPVQQKDVAWEQIKQIPTAWEHQYYPVLGR